MAIRFNPANPSPIFFFLRQAKRGNRKASLNSNYIDIPDKIKNIFTNSNCPEDFWQAFLLCDDAIKLSHDEQVSARFGPLLGLFFVLFMNSNATIEEKNAFLQSKEIRSEYVPRIISCIQSAISAEEIKLCDARAAFEQATQINRKKVNLYNLAREYGLLSPNP
jgi:hypothetical protein